MTAYRTLRLVRPLGVALIALGLSGCQQSSGPVAGKAVTPDVGVRVAALSPEKTDVKVLAAPPKPKPAPEKVYPAPAHLSGMKQDQVIRLLGEPGFERRDAPALIWQYRTHNCALDLFLYQPEDGSGYRVDHFEARNRNNKAVSEMDCFVSLLKAHEQRRAG